MIESRDHNIHNRQSEREREQTYKLRRKHAPPNQKPIELISNPIGVNVDVTQTQQTACNHMHKNILDVNKI